MLVELKEQVPVYRTRGAKPFRYEEVWQTHADYDQMVLENWQRGSGKQGLAGVLGALQNMQEMLGT